MTSAKKTHEVSLLSHPVLWSEFHRYKRRSHHSSACLGSSNPGRNGDHGVREGTLSKEKIVEDIPGPSSSKFGASSNWIAPESSTCWKVLLVGPSDPLRKKNTHITLNGWHVLALQRRVNASKPHTHPASHGETNWHGLITVTLIQPSK